jgi:periodic tryptophan protein 2
MVLIFSTQLNSKNLMDGNPVDDHGDSGDETTYNAVTLPGAKRGDDGSRSSKVEVLTRQLGFSSTGREWAAVSGEGLHVYSLDDEMMFDPIQLSESVTPVAVQTKLNAGQYSLALRMAIYLNEVSLIKDVLDHTPYDKISLVVKSIDPLHLEHIMQVVSTRLADSAHVEFFLQWCLQLLEIHGLYMEKHRSLFMSCYRSMHKIIWTKKDDLKSVSDSNRYMLEYFESQAHLHED